VQPRQRQLLHDTVERLTLGLRGDLADLAAAT